MNTSEPSAALTLNADFVSKAISSSATFETTLAEYPALSVLTSASAIPALPSTLTAPSIPATPITSPETVTFMFTVSPGSASTSGIIHEISPS